MSTRGSDDTVSFWESAARSRLARLNGIAQNDAAPTLIDTVDAELTAANLALHSLAAYRNTLIPVARVPPELLARIFTLLANEPIPEIPGPWLSTVSGKLGWINVSHVCSRWRAVALSSRTLWQVINFSLGSSWMRELLARSKSAPIAFDNKGAPLSMAHADLILQHMSRTTSLKLRHTGEGAGAASLYERLTLPAPLLERVSIDTKSALSLPQNIFGGHAPHLRSVSMTSFDNFPWTSPVWKHLGSLTLKMHIPSANAAVLYHPSLDDLLNMLEGASSLTWLSLVNYLPLSSDTRTGSPYVKLERLQHLELNGHVLDCASLVRRLKFPASTQLDITSKGDDTDDFVTLLSALSDYISSEIEGVEQWPQLAFSRKHVDGSRINIDAYRLGIQKGNFFDTGFQSDVSLTFRWEFDEDASDYEVEVGAVYRLARATVQAFSPPHLRSVIVNLSSPWSVGNWHGVLINATGLRAVKSYGLSGLGACRAFATSTLDDPAVDPPQVMFPKLVELHLEDVGPEPDFLEWTPLFPLLCKLVDTRQLCGSPLDTLRLNTCEIEEEEVETLRGLVRLFSADEDEEELEPDIMIVDE